MIVATMPRIVFPQPKPSLSYIGGPARGKNVPKMLLIAVAAAMADAA